MTLKKRAKSGASLGTVRCRECDQLFTPPIKYPKQGTCQKCAGQKSGLARIGTKQSEETKKKRSEALKGMPVKSHPHTLESKRKISVANKGKRRSEESRNKMSVAQRTIVIDGESIILPRCLETQLQPCPKCGRVRSVYTPDNSSMCAKCSRSDPKRIQKQKDTLKRRSGRKSHFPKEFLL